MCRVLVYAGKPLPLDELLYKPSSSLARQSLDPRQLGTLNLGGFGLVAWDPSSHRPEHPFAYRSTTLPVFDANLRSLASKVRSTCALAHVRGVPYEASDDYGPHNLHPFQYEGCGWAMAHNGFLHGYPRLRQTLLGHVHPDVAPLMRGTSDSEGIYALVMSNLDDRASAGPDALVEALLGALRIVRKARHLHGLDQSSSVNLFFANGRDCVALRYAFDFGCYPTDDPASLLESSVRYLSLWYTLGERFEVEQGEWRMTGDPDRTDSVLIASEPLSRDVTGWVEVPEYTAVIARAEPGGVRLTTLAVDLLAMRSSRRVSPRNFLAGLSPDHFEVFRQLMTPVSYADGQPLFEQGQAADAAWFLDEGHVTLSVRLPGGGESRLAVLGPGEVLGELALMSDAARTASARATGPVRALQVDRKDFQGMLAWFHPASFAVMGRLALLVAERLRETTARVAQLDGIEPPPRSDEPPEGEARPGCSFDWRAFLPALPFFAEMTRGDIDRLLSITGSQVFTLPRGAALHRAGAAADGGCHLLLRGAVERRAADAHASRRLEVLGPGRAVGELSALLGSERVAHTFAREEATLLAVPRPAFEALTGEAHRVSFRFLAALTRGLIERLCRINRLVSRTERERRSKTPVLHADETSSRHLWAGRVVGAEVLVVDDSPMNRAILRAHLQAMGHAPTEAENGRVALDLLAQRRFDAILLDVQMPEMDGYETLRRLHDDPALRAIPVLMITAVEGLDSAVRCLRLGAEDYLPRLFDAGVLRARLDACLERGRMRG